MASTVHNDALKCRIRKQSLQDAICRFTVETEEMVAAAAATHAASSSLALHDNTLLLRQVDHHTTELDNLLGRYDFEALIDDFFVNPMDKTAHERVRLRAAVPGFGLWNASRDTKQLGGADLIGDDADPVDFFGLDPIYDGWDGEDDTITNVLQPLGESLHVYYCHPVYIYI